MHVVDLADAHLKALEHLKDGGETTVVNLGTGIGSSVLEVLAAAERIAGRPVPHELAPRRPGDPVALYADDTKCKRVLGWSGERTLDEIIASAYAWHSTHLDGYGD